MAATAKMPGKRPAAAESAVVVVLSVVNTVGGAESAVVVVSTRARRRRFSSRHDVLAAAMSASYFAWVTMPGAGVGAVVGAAVGAAVGVVVGAADTLPLLPQVSSFWQPPTSVQQSSSIVTQSQELSSSKRTLKTTFDSVSLTHWYRDPEPEEPEPEEPEPGVHNVSSI